MSEDGSGGSEHSKRDSSRARRVLIVSGHREVRDVIGQWFEARHWQTVACNGVVVALDRAGTLLPSVVVVDLQLRGIAWHVLIESLRQRQWARGLRAIGITSDEPLPRSHQHFLLLLDGTLRKPVDAVALDRASSMF